MQPALQLLAAALPIGAAAGRTNDKQENLPADAGGGPSGTVAPDAGGSTEGSPADAGVPDGQGADRGADVALPVGARLSPADQALLDTPAEREAIIAAAELCGMNGLTDADPRQRIADCVATDIALSAPCGDCHEEMFHVKHPHEYLAPSSEGHGR